MVVGDECNENHGDRNHHSAEQQAEGCDYPWSEPRGLVGARCRCHDAYGFRDVVDGERVVAAFALQVVVLTFDVFVHARLAVDGGLCVRQVGKTVVGGGDARFQFAAFDAERSDMVCHRSLNVVVHSLKLLCDFCKRVVGSAGILAQMFAFGYGSVVCSHGFLQSDAFCDICSGGYRAVGIFVGCQLRRHSLSCLYLGLDAYERLCVGGLLRQQLFVGEVDIGSVSIAQRLLDAGFVFSRASVCTARRLSTASMNFGRRCCSTVPIFGRRPMGCRSECRRRVGPHGRRMCKSARR